MSITEKEVSDIFSKWKEIDEDGYADYLADLGYNASAGMVLDFPAEVMPYGYTVSVEEEDTTLMRDSYGYSVNEGTNFIVMKFTDASENSVLFMLTGGYSSYEGWDWNVRDIKQVQSVPKTVYAWEVV
jgi:hypothetical protein